MHPLHVETMMDSAATQTEGRDGGAGTAPDLWRLGWRDPLLALLPVSPPPCAR